MEPPQGTIESTLEEKIQVKDYFTKLLSDETNEKSTGLAAIETLMQCLKKSQGKLAVPQSTNQSFSNDS